MALISECKAQYCDYSRVACGFAPVSTISGGEESAGCLAGGQVPQKLHKFASTFDMKAESAP